MAEFPHLDGSTAFPYENVDVWKYRNDFDYTRWPANVTVKAMNVPWCGDYDNVVKFADDNARDAWFNEQDGETFVLTTMVHVVPGTAVKLPVPAPALQGCNYLVVDMPRYTDDGTPVDNATGTWKRRYFYFMDDVTQRAASTTECTLRIDVWTTYINDLHLSYAMLDRGHAPVEAVSVDRYLADPINENMYLLAPDVSYSDARIARKSAVREYNAPESQYFVMVASVSIGGNWGTLDAPRVPGKLLSNVCGVPGPYAYAVDPSDASAFLTDVEDVAPQFLMTVQGAFFVDRSLVQDYREFTFAGHRVVQLSAGIVVEDFLNLRKEDFAYPDEVAEFAKLYTYPYAKINVTDANGASLEVRIEDTDGTVQLSSAVMLVMPWIAIDVNLLGVGGNSISLSFANFTARTLQMSGMPELTNIRLNVPVYTVSQAASVVANYTSDYDRAQAQLAASNALASAQASNATAQQNANASASTARTNAGNSAGAALSNANNSASNITSNNAVNVALNSNLTAISNDASSHGATLSNNAADSYTTIDNQVCTAGYIADKEGLAVAATNNDMQAAANAATNVLTGIASVATGNIGAALGAVAGAVNVGATWSAANQSNAVSQSNADNIYQATFNANLSRNAAGTTYTLGSTNVQNSAKSDSTSAQNSASTSIAGNNAALVTGNAQNSYDAATTNAQNSYGTATGNAARTKSTADANAERAYNTAVSAISNGLAQAGVAAPSEWGTRANGEHAHTRPIALIAQIVTQPTGAIMQAGAQFARWGYALNQQWRIDDELQVMKHFTYWQCSEVYCAGTGNALEFAQQMIKDIFKNGVTVWSVPEEIGMVSIYDNFK